MSKRLIGVVHLPALPGSPRSNSIDVAVTRAELDAEILAKAGFDSVIVENYGDVPFFAERVPPITVAAMTACVLAAKKSGLDVGVNVLRNDADSALSIASCTGSVFIRVNVHTGARVTDQGIVQGRAAETLRLRRNLDAETIQIWADVDVKHSAPLGARSLQDEIGDAVERGLADAILITGSGTGQAIDMDVLRLAKAASRVPVFAASGVTDDSVASILAECDGVIVGSTLRKDGKAGGPIDATKAANFVRIARSSDLRSP